MQCWKNEDERRLFIQNLRKIKVQFSLVAILQKDSGNECYQILFQYLRETYLRDYSFFFVFFLKNLVDVLIHTPYQLLKKRKKFISVSYAMPCGFAGMTCNLLNVSRPTSLSENWWTQKMRKCGNFYWNASLKSEFHLGKSEKWCVPSRSVSRRQNSEMGMTAPLS